MCGRQQRGAASNPHTNARTHTNTEKYTHTETESEFEQRIRGNLAKVHGSTRLNFALNERDAVRRREKESEREQVSELKMASAQRKPAQRRRRRQRRKRRQQQQRQQQQQRARHICVAYFSARTVAHCTARRCILCGGIRINCEFRNFKEYMQRISGLKKIIIIIIIII